MLSVSNLLNFIRPCSFCFNFGPIGIESDDPITDNENCDQTRIHFVGKENGSVQLPVVDRLCLPSIKHFIFTWICIKKSSKIYLSYISFSASRCMSSFTERIACSSLKFGYFLHSLMQEKS